MNLLKARLAKSLWIGLALLLLPFYSSATHIVGADLTYQCLGGNQYQVNLQFYRDCSGVSAPSSATININSASCGQSTSVTLTQISFAEASPLCPAELPNSSCNGGSLQGVEVYQYSGTITLPAACTDWVLSYRTGNRNNVVTNITNPGSAWMYIEALLNNVDGGCNSSPSFTTPPVPYICEGVPFEYNHGVIDAEGDSIVYSMITPLDNAGTGGTFNAGFSATQPMSTTGSFGFNPNTGQISITPNGTQIAAIAVLVEEFRNGVLIGNTIRDMQIVVINCSNNVLSVDPVSNVSGASLSGTTFSTCEGNNMSFRVRAQDPDATDLIQISETVTANLPGATTTIVDNVNPAYIDVNWTVPNGPLANYNFTLTFEDNSCPIPGFQVLGYTVQLPTVRMGNQNIEKCPSQTLTTALSANSGTAGTYAWGPATGLSCTNCQNPTATVNAPSTYRVTFTDGATGCTATNAVNIINQDIQLNVSASTNNYCTGDPPVQLEAELLINGVPLNSSNCVTERNMISNPMLGNNNTHNFGGIPTSPNAGATLDICVQGDINSTNENWTIQDENGNTLTTIADASGPAQCGAAECVSLTVSQAQLASWAADGTVSFTSIGSSAVNPSLCTDDSVSITLSYCGATNYTEAMPLGVTASCYDQGIQASGATLNNITTITFAGTPIGASGGGTLTIYAYGDLNGSNEVWDIDDENGTPIGSIGGGGTQCGTVHSTTITLTDAQLASWAANGSIVFTATDQGGINESLCGNDSLRMELSYCTTPSSSGDCSGTTLNYTHQLLFNGSVPDASSNVSLEFCLEGDYGATSEEVELFGEDGVSLGVFNEATAGASYSDCGSPGFCNTVLIPTASWNSWNDDGQVALTLVPNNNVNFSCSGSYSCLVSSNVDYEIGGASNYSWSPAATLSDPNIANPTATPIGASTTYQVSATDGSCAINNNVTISCILLAANCENFQVENSESGQPRLFWTLAQEEDNAGIHIERAHADGDFQRIAFIPSAGNQAAEQNYQWQENQILWPNSNYYYRLLLEKLDGSLVQICEQRHFRYQDDKGFNFLTLYPNPSRSTAFLRLQLPQDMQLEVQITDVLGRNLAQMPQLTLQAGIQEFELYPLANLPAGQYFICIKSEGGSYQKTLRFSKIN